MCFGDTSWLNDTSSGLSRRHFLGTGLAAGLAATAMDWGKSLLLPGIAEGAEAAPKGGGPGGSGVNFTWFGTNGWEINIGNKTILTDPWFGRFDTGFFAGKFDPKTPFKTDEAFVDQHIKKADQILIGHGHWDHMADIPYIAKKTGAMVIGSETHGNVLRAAGVAVFGPDAASARLEGSKAFAKEVMAEAGLRTAAGRAIQFGLRLIDRQSIP